MIQPRTAVFLAALVLAGCVAALTPQQHTDLAVFDMCAAPADEKTADVRTEIGWGMRRGYTLPAVIGGMEIMAAEFRKTETPVRRLPAGAPELRYLTHGMTSSGLPAAINAGARLTAIRQCLTAKGYRFTEPTP